MDTQLLYTLGPIGVYPLMFICCGPVYQWN